MVYTRQRTDDQWELEKRKFPGEDGQYPGELKEMDRALEGLVGDSVLGEAHALLASATSIGATTITLDRTPSSYMAALGLGQIVIDAYTTGAEIRKITGVSGNTLTLDLALASAHAIDDVILWVPDSVFLASWFGMKADDSDASASGNVAGFNRFVSQFGTTTGKTVAGTLACMGGIYRMDGELVVDHPSYDRAQITLEGAGDSVTGPGTELYWPTDLGTGKFALRFALGQTYSRMNMRDICFRGPATTGTLGVEGCNMNGILIVGGMDLRSVNVQAFRSGLYLTGNHVDLTRVISQGNYYGGEWGDVPGGYGSPTFGDFHFSGCNFTACRMANWGISGDASLQGVTIENTHLGGAPYGLYGEPTRTNQLLAIGLVFVNSPFEGVGNGAIYDEKTAGNGIIDGFSMLNSGQVWSPSQRIAARPKDYAVYCGTIRYLSGEMGFNQGDIAIFGGPTNYTAFGHHWTRNLAVTSPGDVAQYNGTGSGRWYGGAPSNLYDLRASLAQGQVSFFKAAGTLVSGTVVAFETASGVVQRVIPWATGRPMAGIALHDATSGQAVAVARSGRIAGVLKASGTTFTPIQLAMIDIADPGKVKPSDGTAPIVMAVDAVSTSTTVTGELMLNEAVTASNFLAASSQAGTTYTLALTDQGTVIDFTNAGAVTVTIPTNASVAFPVGTAIELVQYGAGQVTVVPAGGVTLNSPGGKTKTASQYASATLRKRATNEWLLEGDIST